MRTLITGIGAGILACASAAHALTVETLPTHNIFYAGVEKQACLRLKVTAKAGESIVALSFGVAGTSLPSDIRAAHLYTTGKVPVFSPHTTCGCVKTTKLASSTTASVGTMTFSAPVALSAGDNYLWLAYDISARAKGGNCIAAECLSVTDGRGGTVLPVAGASGSKTATVFPFEYRIAPYYRPRWITQYRPGHLNATHFKYLTDLIFFGVCNNGTEIVPQKEVGSGEPEVVEERLAKALEKVKEMRDEEESKIILGFSNGEEFVEVLNDKARRDELAANLANYIMEKGYDGVNINWEYPRDSGCAISNWNNFGFFLAALRENLAGTGATISLAINPRYDMPPASVFDQADYVCTMSYDAPLAEGHSPMSLAQADIVTLEKAGIPKAKIILGLPFYGRFLPFQKEGPQLGYRDILSSFPKIELDSNTCIHPKTGKTCTFNGVTLIGEKCKYVVQQGIGGVMVWAYDCDAPLSHPKSLARAMYNIIWQKKK